MYDSLLRWCSSPQVATQIVDKCKLIPRSSLGAVEAALQQLIHRRSRQHSEDGSVLADKGAGQGNNDDDQGDDANGTINKKNRKKKKSDEDDEDDEQDNDNNDGDNDGDNNGQSLGLPIYFISGVCFDFDFGFGFSFSFAIWVIQYIQGSRHLFFILPLPFPVSVSVINTGRLGGLGGGGGQIVTVEASIEEVGSYMEALYEDDMDVKVRAVAAVCRIAARLSACDGGAQVGALMRLSLLTQQTRFWPEFHECETLLGTLSRVLRDDHRRSTDLAIHITGIFFALSSASQFHSALVENQVKRGGEREREAGASRAAV